MKLMAPFVVLALALVLAGTAMAADFPRAGSIAGINPLADPFMANAKVELPPPPPMASLGAALPAVPMFNNEESLPPGLRVTLIRDRGHALLSTGEASAFSIPVTNGKLVQIAGQAYHAEVTNTAVRLYASAKGKLVWAGTLAVGALIVTPVDMAQAQFVPPLSAGVSPGLRSGSSSGGSALIIKSPGSQ